ncbi:MAG: hypothetical protein JWQ35_2129 [Bacteriovoracaceae bacterium]|nr:hypothetical protein [Bacteriovoracaceae bacterium]
MSIVFTILLAGIAGTSGMTLFLYAMHGRKIRTGDIIRAVGSIVTRSEKNAFFVGLILHYCMGIFFAFVYSLLIGLSPVKSHLDSILFCSFFGFLHGVIMVIIFTIFVAEHHPIKRFQQAGVSVVVAQFLAHIIYGTLVGAVLGPISIFSNKLT